MVEKPAKKELTKKELIRVTISHIVCGFPMFLLFLNFFASGIVEFIYYDKIKGDDDCADGNTKLYGLLFSIAFFKILLLILIAPVALAIMYKRYEMTSMGIVAFLVVCIMTISLVTVFKAFDKSVQNCNHGVLTYTKINSIITLISPILISMFIIGEFCRFPSDQNLDGEKEVARAVTVIV